MARQSPDLQGAIHDVIEGLRSLGRQDLAGEYLDKFYAWLQAVKHLEQANSEGRIDNNAADTMDAATDAFERVSKLVDSALDAGGVH